MKNDRVTDGMLHRHPHENIAKDSILSFVTTVEACRNITGTQKLFTVTSFPPLVSHQAKLYCAIPAIPRSM
jgi:hypothetical protein